MMKIFGVPDPRFGEEIAAWIQLKVGENATVQEIKDFCKGRVSVLQTYFSCFKTFLRGQTT